MPAALACLQALGLAVSVGDGLWRAESERLVVVAEDPLLLLGLVKLHELRGARWRPSDAEVDAFLALDQGQIQPGRAGRDPPSANIAICRANGGLRLRMGRALNRVSKVAECAALLHNRSVTRAIRSASLPVHPWLVNVE